MLSTIDNPNNPWTQFDEWLNYDLSHGYNSLSLLGRITITSDVLSEADQALAIEQAIDEIVTQNVSGMHIKVPEPAVQTTE
jgi:hypothetical protein